MLLHPRNQDVDHVVLDLGEHPFVVTVELVVLGGYDDRVDTLRDALIAILDGHLALGVGAQIGHLLALLTDVGQGAHDQVGQVEGDGHIVLRLIGGIAEHHALVACSLLFFIAVIYATVDVGTLLVDGTQDAAGVAVELIF